ncbi:hypothetical protein ANN_21920 [Periplaneta americana]|uniref:Uncharacterized protein n=1 Tax=Periplaneta americana TaxID=6978 RepID=A0ABQ8S6Q7_PERAM|nr:hypothetical protein ANN_21920 [Periplaneta americana]
MKRSHMSLLIVIRPSDGDVKLGGPLGAIRQGVYKNQPRIIDDVKNNIIIEINEIIEKILQRTVRNMEGRNTSSFGFPFRLLTSSNSRVRSIFLAYVEIQTGVGAEDDDMNINVQKQQHKANYSLARYKTEQNNK